MKKGNKQSSFQKKSGKALTIGKQINTHQEPINRGYAPERAASPITLFFICALLITTICIPYLQVINHGFINYDDNSYILNNPNVISGLNMHNVIWAFTTFYFSYWHPLTWLSHMLDCQVFGLNPGMHHLVNVLFHIINTLLLFVVFFRMTGALWKSFFIAALFGLHPLHVESVAWASERKDVLSTFFWMLTMMGYLWYVKQRNIHRYLLMIIFYMLGLLSKPMLVTLPFTLLLLDFWPLNRLEPVQVGGHSKNQGHNFLSGIRWSGLPSLIAEKIPMLVLAMISSSLTVLAQRSGGSVSSLEALRLGTRMLNVITSYVTYLCKMIWPLNLAVFYPYPYLDDFYVLGAILSFFIVLLITTLVLLVMKNLPYLSVGWFWYLGTLVPVIGIIQVGEQSMADRYTYIPLIGIFLMIVWGLEDLISSWHYKKSVIGVVSAVILALLMGATWIQVGFWKNSEILFRHAIEVTKNNDLAYNKLAKELFNEKRYDEAVAQLQECLKSRRHRSDTYNNLGNVMVAMGNLDGAINNYKESLRINPHQGSVYYNIGVSLYEKGDIKKAFEYFQEAVREEPDLTDEIKNIENAGIKQK